MNTPNDTLQEEFEDFLGRGFDAKNKIHEGETHRWLFCADSWEVKQGDAAYDCACCLGYKGECPCVCHARIKEISDWWLKKKDAELETQKKLLREKVEKLKPILWSDDPNRYLENVARYNTIDDVLALLQDKKE